MKKGFDAAALALLPLVVAGVSALAGFGGGPQHHALSGAAGTGPDRAHLLYQACLQSLQTHAADATAASAAQPPMPSQKPLWQQRQHADMERCLRETAAEELRSNVPAEQEQQG